MLSQVTLAELNKHHLSRFYYEYYIFISCQSRNSPKNDHKNM